MPAPPTTRTRFWKLAPPPANASGSAGVIRHAVAVIDTLQREPTSPGDEVRALSFLAALANDEVYAAPEQLRGEYTDQRSLVFSSGVLLFEELAGHHPFGPRRPGSEPGLRMLSSNLRAVLRTAVSPFAKDRWSSLGTLRAELLRCADEIEQSLPAEPAAAVAAPAPPPTTPGGAARARRAPTTPPPLPSQRRATAARRSTTDAPKLQQHLSSAPSVTPHRTHARHTSHTTIVRIPGRRKRFSPRLALAVAVAAIAITALAVWQPTANGSADAAARTAPKLAPSARGSAADRPVSIPISQPIARPLVVVAKPTAPSATAASTARFDANFGGNAALAAARSCFGPKRLRDGVEFSASLRFTAASDRSTRVFWPDTIPLRTKEKRCLDRALKGISAGAPPREPTIVTYSWWLGTTRGRFWARERG